MICQETPVLYLLQLVHSCSTTCGFFVAPWSILPQWPWLQGLSDSNFLAMTVQFEWCFEDVSLHLCCHPTLWSQCECQPSHYGPQWKWAEWHRSRFAVLPERCVEPSPHSSARETVQSCKRPMQVSDADIAQQHRGTTSIAYLPLIWSAAVWSGVRCAVIDALRLANKTPCFPFFPPFVKKPVCD